MDSDANPSRRLGPTKPGSARERVTLWCGVCGRSRSFTRGEISGFIEAGWLLCCGRTMGLGRTSLHPEAGHASW